MGQELRGNSKVKQCLAIIDYADGSKDFQTCKLKYGGKFAISEMRKWLTEQSEKAVENIRFYRLPKIRYK